MVGSRGRQQWGQSRARLREFCYGAVVKIATIVKKVDMARKILENDRDVERRFESTLLAEGVIGTLRAGTIEEGGKGERGSEKNAKIPKSGQFLSFNFRPQKPRRGGRKVISAQ